MKRFDEFTYDDAVAEIERRKKDRLGDAYQVNHDMAELHDFWQDGELWVGPRGGLLAWNAEVRDRIKAQYIPGGAVLEALANFVRGMLGKQANIQAVPAGPVSEAEEEARNREAGELIEVLSVWWDRVELWEKMRRAVARSRWAGWGPLRLRIPTGRLIERETEDGTVIRELPKFGTLEEALEAIELHAPEPDQCIVIQHPDTQQRAAIFHYTDQADNGSPVNYVELWYEEDGKTVLRILQQGAGEATVLSYDWGGALPISEVDGEVMITEPVRRAEAALAFASTNFVRTVETAGFRERYTINAEPAGLWLPARPEGGAPRTMDDGQGGTLYFHPLPRSLGAGITTDLIGIPVESDTDGEKRATPQITIADPVDPKYATDAEEFARARVLQRCGQGHLAMIASGEASGFAYEQARAAFAGDLQLHVDPTERGLTQILEAVVAMAESMMVRPLNVLERLRLIVTLTPDAGPISPEMRKQYIEEAEKGCRSRSSAMALIGIDDVQAELEAIEQDPLNQISMTERRAKAMAAFPDEVPLVTRAILVGYTEEEARQYFGEADAARVRAEEQARDEIRDALERGTGEGAAA